MKQNLKHPLLKKTNFFASKYIAFETESLKN